MIAARGMKFKNLASKNQLVDFDKTWYEASEIQAHYILFK